MLPTGVPASPASNITLAARLSHETPRNCVTCLSIAAMLAIPRKTGFFELDIWALLLEVIPLRVYLKSNYISR